MSDYATPPVNDLHRELRSMPMVQQVLRAQELLRDPNTKDDPGLHAWINDHKFLIEMVARLCH